MNLQKINSSISDLKRIMTQESYDGWQLWKLADIFQTNWDLQATDFKGMFENSFAINSPLWIVDGYYPKKAMLHYIDMYPELVRSMFMDLMNDKKDITGRINRFEFQCQELYKMDRSVTEKVLPHYHSDKRMIFIYLSFRFPDKYPLYDFSAFQSYMECIESKRTPKPEEIERYIKVSQIINNFVTKDEELMQIIADTTNRTDDNLKTMLIVSELYILIGK